MEVLLPHERQHADGNHGGHGRYQGERMVMRVAYVRLFHQLRTPWNGFFLRFFPSEGRSTTTGPVDAEPVV